ncbi:PIG-L deacetylase family protein [Desulfobacter latus]|uniref:PIG-L family deacetylase n=1 Tax=Desulfobacter latus TaxID=2292 RepID=A0A850T6F9_9BACT|nr:PIG-L family deacetylase [Desulfobacter latus]NWH04942.1 PIG-L family deacetylase [Desulfobacter latus]
MNVLAIGAHYDDIELGCAGTLIKHVQNNDKVTIFVITDSSYASPTHQSIRGKAEASAEGEAAAAIIGADLIGFNLKTFHVFYDENLTSSILTQIERLNIDTIYAPWVHDVHRDHKNACRAAIMAGKHVPRFLMYQANWYNSEHTFKKQAFKDISDVFEQKIKALESHKSEFHRTGNKWLDYITTNNRLDGLKIGVKYAESFEVIRYLI